jgi:hypothetical protein
MRYTKRGGQANITFNQASPLFMQRAIGASRGVRLAEHGRLAVRQELGVGRIRVIGAPLNAASGQRLQFVILQDGTGGRAVT